MERRKVGEKLENFTFDTPFVKEQNLYTLSKEKNIALLFLRYYGCTICQVDIHKYIAQYPLFKEKDTEVFVVLQSDPSLIAEQTKKEEVPFVIICDPEQKLYKEFAIEPAKSKLGLVSKQTLKKMKESKKLGFVHGAYEGNELQLPAVFLADKEKTITFAHYGKSAGDVLEPQELLAKIG